jgi:glutamate--cysteine ligase catalytic subunit
MGQLEAGAKPLDWTDAKAFAEFIREHGITQLIHIFERLKDRTGDRLFWGDEVCSFLFELTFRLNTLW